MRGFDLAAALALGVLATGLSGVAAATTPAEREAADEAAWAAASKAAVEGPANLPLANQARLKLPAGLAFVPAAEANQVMESLGNSSKPSRHGLILPLDPAATWMIDVAWIKDGYVKDGEAKSWSADALLQTLRDGTEAGNAKRQERGFPLLEVVGWAEPPAYDSTTHRLVWSLLARRRGDPADAPQTVNYNSYALGRDGYFELDLITASDRIAADKAIVRNLLGQLDYLPGKRYQDFAPAHDKVAAYGIGALVGAVAVKKLGLLAVIGVFLLKVWKLALLAIAGGIAIVRRRKTGRKEPPPVDD